MNKKDHFYMCIDYLFQRSKKSIFSISKVIVVYLQRVGEY